MRRPDPVAALQQQFLQRQAWRVKQAAAAEKQAAGRAFLQRLIRHLDAKVGRDVGAG